MDRSDTIFEALQMPKDAVFSALSRALRRLHPDSAVVETESQFFDPMEFYASGQCAVSDVESSGTQWTKEWWQEEARLYDIPYNVWLNVEWQGNHLELVQVGVTGHHCLTVRST